MLVALTKSIADGLSQQTLDTATRVAAVTPRFKLLTPQESVEKMLKQLESMGPEGSGRLHMVPF